MDRYGPPSALRVVDIPKPSPTGNEVLVKIHTTAINDYDWSMVRGKPYLYRLLFGLSKPKRPIAGMELSGVVEEVGPDCKQFNVGDEVYGDISEYGFGTFCEYISINEKSLLKKPESLSHEEATALPHAFGLAWQGLIEQGKLSKGEKVLINGAGGGVGTLGLQIAKTLDAEVTGVDTGPKLQMMKDLGFDKVIDYKKDNFTQLGERYDLMLDAKSSFSPFAYRNALKPDSRYVTVGGTIPRLLQIVAFKGIIKSLNKVELSVLALKANKGLEQIEDLIKKHELKSVIDGPYELHEVPRLVQYFGEGKHSGKVVIKLT